MPRGIKQKYRGLVSRSGSWSGSWSSVVVGVGVSVGVGVVVVVGVGVGVWVGVSVGVVVGVSVVVGVVVGVGVSVGVGVAMTTTTLVEPGYSETIRDGVVIEQDIDTNLLPPQPANQPENSLGKDLLEAGQVSFLGIMLMACFINLFHPWWP